MKRYIIKKRLIKFLISIIDLVGSLISIVVRFFNKKTPGNIASILLVKLDNVENIILSTIIPKNLKSHYKGAKITFLVPTAAKNIVINNPYVDEVICYDAPWIKKSGKSFSEFLKFFKLVREFSLHKYDIGFDLAVDFRHIILMSLAGVRFRVGYGVAGGGFLLHHLANFSYNIDKIENNIDLLKFMGINIVSSTPKLYFSEKDNKFTQNLIKENNIYSDDFLSIINTDAKYGSGDWQKEKFKGLIDILREQFNSKIIVIGSKIDEMDHDHSKAPYLQIRESLSVGSMQLLIDRASLYVGVDSFVSRVALLAETPTVLLLGSSNSNFEAFKRKHAIIIQKDIPCKDCGKLNCEENICTDLISVEDVIETLDKLIPPKND